jgi:two-component system sensor histidine kinase KdpD
MKRFSLRSGLWSYLLVVLGIAAVTGVLAPLRHEINTTTIGFAFLLFVLSVAIVWGSRPALLASLVGMLCYNFFFLPPTYTLTITEPQNWIALAAFFITALAVGQLSARARRRAEEAEAGRIENQRLYEDLQEAFERASEAEVLRRSERLKSALLDAVTHDLRTPLTSIKASATLLLEAGEPGAQMETFSPAEQKTMLRVISDEADRLDRFVASIVDLARIEAGDIKLSRNWGSVEEIIEAALARAEPLMQQHQLRILVEKELPVIRVDARAVAEVIYALIDNATKYAPSGVITIKASRAFREMLQLSVEDQGPGISQDLRQRVFEKFFHVRGKQLGVGRPEGIGMGLSIAKGIVEAHGGRIWMEDGEGGKGVKVNFTVPVGDDELEAPTAAIESQTEEAEALRSNEPVLENHGE